MEDLSAFYARAESAARGRAASHLYGWPPAPEPGALQDGRDGRDGAHGPQAREAGPERGVASPDGFLGAAQGAPLRGFAPWSPREAVRPRSCRYARRRALAGPIRRAPSCARATARPALSLGTRSLCGSHLASSAKKPEQKKCFWRGRHETPKFRVLGKTGRFEVPAKIRAVVVETISPQ